LKRTHLSISLVQRKRFGNGGYPVEVPRGGNEPWRDLITLDEKPGLGVSDKALKLGRRRKTIVVPQGKIERLEF
jgi:hypothetical protein